MAERDDELAALATRTQQRGPVTDYFGAGPTVLEHYGPIDLGPELKGSARLALSRCKHGTEWPEGRYGCVPCVAEAHAAHPVRQAV